MDKREKIDIAVKQLGEAIKECLPEDEEKQKKLSPKQLSKRWDGIITEKTLSNWRYAKTGPKYNRIGGKIVYPIESVIEYEKKRNWNIK